VASRKTMVRLHLAFRAVADLLRLRFPGALHKLAFLIRGPR
jgi:hypothetical protein